MNEKSRTNPFKLAKNRLKTVLELQLAYGTPGLGVWNAGQSMKRPRMAVKRRVDAKMNAG